MAISAEHFLDVIENHSFGRMCVSGVFFLGCVIASLFLLCSRGCIELLVLNFIFQWPSGCSLHLNQIFLDFFS